MLAPIELSDDELLAVSGGVSHVAMGAQELLNSLSKWMIWSLRLQQREFSMRSHRAK